MRHQKNALAFLDVYRAVMSQPDIVVRGAITKELLNFGMTINPSYPITSFVARKFALNYAKKEILWYLRGDRFDKSIVNEAGAWNTLIAADGGINSNYGQVIFNGSKQIDWVVEELVRDTNSRRAVMVIGDPALITKENNDHRCTMYISYMIRDSRLIQSVHMRSNDAIFGLTNDVFFFGYLHQMVWQYLRRYYPVLELGDYHHFSNSMHIYQRHFKMALDIIDKDLDGWYEIDCPMVSSADEVDGLRWNCARDASFSNWLKESE